MTPDDQPETFILAGRDDETGERHETEMSAAQTLDLVAAIRRGDPYILAFMPTDEELVADEDGELIHRESAIPRPPDNTHDRKDDPR